MVNDWRHVFLVSCLTFLLDLLLCGFVSELLRSGGYSVSCIHVSLGRVNLQFTGSHVQSSLMMARSHYNFFAQYLELQALTSVR